MIQIGPAQTAFGTRGFIQMSLSTKDWLGSYRCAFLQEMIHCVEDSRGFYKRQFETVSKKQGYKDWGKAC